ncbi:MAG: DNA polymerase III subunit [Clostridia bacterium]|nr:DNA polymerase III subunit [Clostridia bacterium]
MFENIIGNEKVKETLKKSIIANRLSHSYMFIGIDGIGKQLFAKEFAKQILCIDSEKTQTGTYCNKCKSCIEFDSSNNPDFKIIDIAPEEKSIKIEQIRNMQIKIAEKPIVSDKKVYIINNADTMTREAQNCLLKTLEEPPEYVTIILIGQNENNFLTTIKSRCTKINFNKIPDTSIKEYIKENLNITDIQDGIIVLCNGSIGKAIKYKENEQNYLSLKNIVENIDKTDVIEILGMAEPLYKAKDTIYELLDSLNIMCLKRAKENIKMANCIPIIEQTKTRLKSNSNFDMSIDNMIFNLWREVN